MKIWIACDHGGFELKQKIVAQLKSVSSERGYEIHDLGTDSTESVDYPDFAELVCKNIHPWTLIDSGKPENSRLTEVGFLICGSGQGMAMRANKHPHIRAALCWNLESTKLSREHNDANVLCLGGRLIEHPLALQMVETFLTTPFAGGRHQQRVTKVSAPV